MTAFANRASMPVVAALVSLLGCASGGGSSTTTQASATVPVSSLALDSDRTGNYEIYLLDAAGNTSQLTQDAAWDSWWPKISPDRKHILLYRTPKGVHDTDYTKTSLWEMASDGSGLHALIANGANGWQFQGHAEWSPDGSRLVMFAGTPANLQIFTTDGNGQTPQAITSRPGPNLDPSWSKDGLTIAFISTPNGTFAQTDYEVYTLPAAGGTATRITNDGLIDNDPYVSPDGSSLAWLTQTLPPGSPGKPLGTWGIRKAARNGSNPGVVIDDGQINSKPDWSSDGTLIRFHRTIYSGTGKFSVFEIHPDGSGLRELTPGQASNNEFPNAGL